MGQQFDEAALSTVEVNNLRILHYSTRVKDDGTNKTIDGYFEESKLEIPLVRPVKTSYGSINYGATVNSEEADLRAKQVEEFLVGLGIPLPSKALAQQLASRAHTAESERDTNKRLLVLMEQMRDAWKAYAGRLEVAMKTNCPRALKRAQKTAPK